MNLLYKWKKKNKKNKTKTGNNFKKYDLFKQCEEI